MRKRLSRRSSRPTTSSLLGFCVTALVASLALGASIARADAIVDGFESGAGWTVVEAGGDGVVFDGLMRTSYGWGMVERSVFVAQPSLVTLEVDVFNGETNTIGWGEPTADRYVLTLGTADLDSVQIHGWETRRLEYQTTEPGETVTVRLAGIDLGYWAGWYGPSFDNLILSVNPAGDTTPKAPETPLNAVYGLVPEGSALTLEAPPDTVFTAILFASYGTPTGVDGRYLLGNCHAPDSVPTVEALVLGRSSATVEAANSRFGDPCPGTYKALAVVAEYAPTSTTTETTPTSTQTTSTTELPPPTTTPSTTTDVPAPQTTTSTSTPATTATSAPISQTSSSSTSTSVVSSVPLTVPPSTSTIVATTEPERVPASPAAPLAELTSALTAEALEEASPEQVANLLETVIATASDLTSEQQELLAAALTAAPADVKKQFEEKANVFAGSFDSYVPTGSTISVRQRRALIAAAATFAAAPAISTRRRM